MQRLSTQALVAGLDSIQNDGSIPASLPQRLFPDVRPGPSDLASAAAFFLSDACPALLLSGGAPAHEKAIARASTWLVNRKASLIARDRQAPNRLLIDALAFIGCARLLDDETLLAHSNEFIAAALTFARDDGVFVEAGGSDTSYQAVNLVVAHEILGLGYRGAHADTLRSAWSNGVDWLIARISANGRLDSSRNTRTCAEEAFLGRPKSVDVREVFRALAYAEVSNGEKIKHLAAFEAWVRTRPDPCDS
ncbi:MAG: hypothetical protein AAFO81_11460 [Pseudomonadota bacterium]